MSFPILSRAICPKCGSRGAKRLGVKDGESLWKCATCSHEFAVKILKLQKSG